MQDALALLVSSLNSVLDLFDQLFTAVGGASAIYLAALVVFLAVRFLLVPLVGTGLRRGSSDKVQKKGRGK